MAKRQQQKNPNEKSEEYKYIETIIDSPKSKHEKVDLIIRYIHNCIFIERKQNELLIERYNNKLTKFDIPLELNKTIESDIITNEHLKENVHWLKQMFRCMKDCTFFCPRVLIVTTKQIVYYTVKFLILIFILLIFVLIINGIATLFI